MDTSNNLDSKKYILQRISIQQFQQQENYIEKHYYFSREDNLISYFNCWKETDAVPVEKTVTKQKQKKAKEKKKMIDIMKRKTKIETEPIAPQKQKVHEDIVTEKLQNFEFIFVQLEYFSQQELPSDFAGCRDFFVITYLLARKLQNKTGVLPCLIPVKNEQNDRIKFFKKGIELQIQLYNLMKYVFRQKQEQYLLKWSQFLSKTIYKAEVNKDQLLIGTLLKNAIEQYLNQPHIIYLVNDQQKYYSIERVTIMNYDTLKMENSQIQIPLQQYRIEYLLKSENDREITLTHQLFEEYKLFGKKGSFIVKWLYHMAT